MKPEPVNRLAIVGVGLIGGSFALAARRGGLAREIVGLGRSRENLTIALERGIVDRCDVEAAVVGGADLVLLATPVGGLARAAAAIAPHLDERAIVMDAGSVKQSVVEAVAAALGGRARFVGAHPIAGTESSGAAAADPDLFRGARCVLTPVPGTDSDALARVRALWEAVGMDVVEMSPAAHDAILATTSHVPHLLAFALSLAAGAARGDDAPPALDFAGPSFLSATRVAASSPEMWRDVLLANAPAVKRALDELHDRLDALAAATAAGDGPALLGLIEQARAVRRALEARRTLAAAPSLLGAAERSVSAATPASAGARGAARPAEAEDSVRVEPATGPLSGSVDVPGDKSIAHRALLFGAIARGTTIVRGVGHGEDNASTMRVLRGLGVELERQGSEVRIAGGGLAGLVAPAAVLDCGNSGTTMRLCAGLLAGRSFVSQLDGDASLRRRPMRRVIEPLAEMGGRIESADGRPPLTVHGGRLHAASLSLEIASAQVKTALLFAGLQAEGRVSIREPALSRDHTERLLPLFGGAVRRSQGDPLLVEIDGPQELRGAVVDVPGDPSAATFWLVAASLVPGSQVIVRGVGVNPTRTGALDVLRAMGARIAQEERARVGDEPVADLLVEAGPLRGTIVAGDTMLRAIDEFPILAVAAACAEGETRFADAGELRVKESDRLAAMAEGLRRLGAAVEESSDGMTIAGPAALSGGEVESHGDHRIAMAFAIAALVARAPVVIRGARSIAVSDPGFLDTLARLREGRP